MWRSTILESSSITSSFLFSILLFAIFRTAQGIEKNCTTDEHECFTCLGRDKLNCDWGRVCCAGACWKLIDEEHDIIAKGCTKDKAEDGSSKQITTDVELPWAKDTDGNVEKLKGTAHYCNQGKNCNGSDRPLSISFASFFLILFTSFLLIS